MTLGVMVLVKVLVLVSDVRVLRVLRDSLAYLTPEPEPKPEPEPEAALVLVTTH